MCFVNKTEAVFASQTYSEGLRLLLRGESGQNRLNTAVVPKLFTSQISGDPRDSDTYI